MCDRIENYAVISDNLFEKFAEDLILKNNTSHGAESRAGGEESHYNYCPDCKNPMDISGSEYQCSICGLTLEGRTTYKNTDSADNPMLRIGTGPNKGRFYNVTNSDYTKIQYKTVLEQLLKAQTRYVGIKFRLNVLHATVDQYNLIQKTVTKDVLGEDGNIKQKKFVHRSVIKNEIL